MITPRDMQLAHKAKKAGAHYSLRIVLEARAAGLPISLAFALVEQETGPLGSKLSFANVFGCDKGGLYCHEAVNAERAAELLAAVKSGHTSNGVGLTQLTALVYLLLAQRMGGLHKPKYQLRVGFTALAADIHRFGQAGGLATYNAGHPGSAFGKRYAREVLDRQKRWHRVLTA